MKLPTPVATWVTMTLAAFMLPACWHKPRNNIQLTQDAFIQFNIPYKVNIGNLRVAGKGAGFSFYSFSTKTSKRIDMFDAHGRFLKTIPLKGLLTNETDFDDITFNSGHFLLLSEKTNNLYSMDTNGTVINVQHFDAPYENSIRREIRASNFNGFVLSDNKYLFKCYYYFADTVYYQRYYDYNNHYPYFMEVDCSDSSHKAISYRLPGFYTRFMPEYGVNIEGAVYAVNNKYVLLSSCYTDSIYVLDKKSMQIIKVLPVLSDYTKPEVEPLIANDTLAISEDELNTRLQTQGLIANITYDPYRKYYYITIFHSTTRKQRKKNGPWSFVVFDSTFNRLGEVNMDENKYDMETLLVTEDGLLFKNLNSASNEFQLYKISVR
jgi:hypothetical protein